jgi:hypothetical protein
VHFLDSHASAPTEITLDLDATDDPVHGEQEGRFFHGFYGHYCYLPLYVFCGEFLLGATLHTADVAPGKRAVEELERIVSQIRARWPDVRIVVRGDSGFCNDEVMSWCEDGGIDFILGLAQNPRLRAEIRDEMAAARAEHERTGEDARVFKDFRYKTRDSWSRERRVVGKAEYITDKENPRFVVTSFSPSTWSARALYEDLYCARGEMENRIKEQQLGPLRRPDQLPHAPRQPASPLVLVDRLPHPPRPASPRARRHPARPRPGRHHPLPSAQDRRHRLRLRAPHLHISQQRLSSQGALRPHPGERRGCVVPA